LPSLAHDGEPPAQRLSPPHVPEQQLAPYEQVPPSGVHEGDESAQRPPVHDPEQQSEDFEQLALVGAHEQLPDESQYPEQQSEERAHAA
jgi:hypothetical protein